MANRVLQRSRSPSPTPFLPQWLPRSESRSWEDSDSSLSPVTAGYKSPRDGTGRGFQDLFPKLAADLSPLGDPTPDPNISLGHSGSAENWEGGGTRSHSHAARVPSASETDVVSTERPFQQLCEHTVLSIGKMLGRITECECWKES